MSEHEMWKVGDTLATYIVGSGPWPRFLDVPWLSVVVAVHGKRDVTIRVHEREERGTRVGFARGGWKLATKQDHAKIALDNARSVCEAALHEAQAAARTEKSAARLDALAAAVRGWL